MEDNKNGDDLTTATGIIIGFLLGILFWSTLFLLFL